MFPRLFFPAVFLIAGCAHQDADLPTCGGEARRPANPHGSILAAAPPASRPVAAPVVEAPQTKASPTADPITGGCA